MNGTKAAFWYRCPVCGNPKMTKYYGNTRLVNFPAYCKRCKTESIIDIAPAPRARAN